MFVSAQRFRSTPKCYEFILCQFFTLPPNVMKIGAVFFLYSCRHTKKTANKHNLLCRSNKDKDSQVKQIFHIIIWLIINVSGSVEDKVQREIQIIIFNLLVILYPPLCMLSERSNNTFFSLRAEAFMGFLPVKNPFNQLF